MRLRRYAFHMHTQIPPNMHACDYILGCRLSFNKLKLTKQRWKKQRWSAYYCTHKSALTVFLRSDIDTLPVLMFIATLKYVTCGLYCVVLCIVLYCIVGWTGCPEGWTRCCDSKKVADASDVCVGKQIEDRFMGWYRSGEPHHSLDQWHD